MLSSSEVRQKFISFFQARGHVIIPSSPLLSDDPSVLLTSAGVQQFKPYYLGDLDPQKDFHSRRIVSVQKCFRTTDIDEVGDNTHLTFFEMLGNFSFGDYYKKEAIQWAYEFITKELGISPDRLSVTVFAGNESVPKDEESYKIWQNIGLTKNKIKFALWDNFWGPTGNQGPCGPTTEIYIDGIEVWNIVFNEYFCKSSREELIAASRHPERSPKGGVEGSHQLLTKLQTPGIDTGMGLERLSAIINKTDNVFATDLLRPLIELLPQGLAEPSKRILADHARGIVFLIADGVRPSNKEAGYILRRLIRRALVIPNTAHHVVSLLKKVITLHRPFYPELQEELIFEAFNDEQNKFQETLAKGIKELNKLQTVDARSAFKLFESYGLPYEVIKDITGAKAKNLKRQDFDKEFAQHQAVSRAGQEKKFGGHGLLLDTGELKAGDVVALQKVTRLHTATHLLQQALRDVLGEAVQQRGSDINADRTRFDFSFPSKPTAEDLKKVEMIVNQKIKDDLPVKYEELPLEVAKKTGALHYFKQKYPDKVKVYYIGSSLEKAYSKEFCGGPHVARTGELGQFKILKEESVGSGTRRIKAGLYQSIEVGLQ